jgi:hypothetical protein
MTSNNSEWERGWFYLRNDGAGLSSYSGKFLKDKADSWHHGVSPPSHRTRLNSLLAALKDLVDGGLTTGCVLVNLHHRRIVPLMERPLRIFEMDEDADPVALVQSQLVPGLFPWEYALTGARRPERQYDAPGVHHASRRPVGEWTPVSLCPAGSRGVVVS